MRTRSGRIAAWLLRLALAGGLAWLASIGPALAQEPTEALIIDALSKARTRSPFPDGDRAMEDRRFIDAWRRQPTRSLSHDERQQVAAIAENRPSIDLEVNFGFDSAVLLPNAVPTVVALGRALGSPQLKAEVILIAGHTDAKGSDGYNQILAERRANTVKRFLVANFGLLPENVLAVGYGRQQLKNEANPLGAENRRVQIVNLRLNRAAEGR